VTTDNTYNFRFNRSKLSVDNILYQFKIQFYFRSPQALVNYITGNISEGSYSFFNIGANGIQYDVKLMNTAGNMFKILCNDGLMMVK